MNQGPCADLPAPVLDPRLIAASAVADAAIDGASSSLQEDSSIAHDGEPLVDLEATRLHVPHKGTRNSRSKPVEPAAEPEWHDDLIGRKLAQYRILEDLGRGSMARVYKAWHLGLERTCALKIIDPTLVARRPNLRDQFWAEARAAANLVHPQVVTIHNLGSDAGFHFIEMEYVQGSVSLRDSIVKDGPFEAGRAARLVGQILLALGAAHRSGIIHRDVKPANVLLTAEGHAKLADFGLAQTRAKLSGANQPLAGTPTFMAPELFNGTPASPQSDIYALGVMFYYVLTGRLPYTSDRIGSLINLHQSEPIPDIRAILPGTHPRLAELIERCLAKSPAARFASSEELGNQLQMLLHHLRDTESLVRECLQGVDAFIQGNRDTFRVLLPQPGDRLQEVMVEVNDGEEGKGERYLSVFSVCGPAEPSYYGYALALNSRLTYGSLSIRYVLGAPMLVMSRTFVRDRMRVGDLRDAILEIAHNADRIEAQMTRLDLY
ncbi:serine/threonine-protein kinase [Planctomyces sp. SH-PL62]|uniref:serine/threonine-protein kinase n=1 Tax=Planctomyces sp. SH-PL62 TaxID=1636152 RepID=UPI00078B8EFC|nr:serine/threonine-protein kinase [Planctomyces sp. SH-PL62]AMV39425.1 Serine/threonine-protein kinase StkP [Planctomyces sp. SH-PL62]